MSGRGVFYLRVFQSSWHLQQLLWYLLWRLEWSVRQFSYPANTLFFLNEVLIHYIHQWTVRFHRHNCVCVIAGVGCLWYCKEGWKLNQHKCLRKRRAELWEKPFSSLQHVLHLVKEAWIFPTKFTWYSSTEVTWEAATCRTDNTSEHSLGIIWWQPCGSFFLSAMSSSPKHSWGKVIINWAEIKLSLLLNWRVCWWLTK